MARVISSPLATQDIINVIKNTKARWGEARARQYRQLILDALAVIAKDPSRGRLYSDERPGIFAYHIRQHGRPARHILFYRTNAVGTVIILRLLHEAMDFENHLQ